MAILSLYLLKSAILMKLGPLYKEMTHAFIRQNLKAEIKKPALVAKAKMQRALTINLNFDSDF